MNTSSTREFGRTGFSVDPLCLGTSSWGPPQSGETSGEAVERIALIADEFFAGNAGTNFLDTSNEYGAALSEIQIGAAIRRSGGVNTGLVVQSKLDRDVATGEFTSAQMWRSLEQSQQRLGFDQIPVLYLHDPENIGFTAAMAPGGPVEALVEMKERGLAAAIGISGGPVDMLTRFVETDLFDALISHNRFTLVDQSASALFDAATERGLGICNAAPYGGGVLTGQARFSGTYGYRASVPEMQPAIDAMAAYCERAGVTLAAAALQFSLRDARVHSTIVGVSTLSRLRQTVEDAAVDIPDTLWSELALLAPAGFALDRP